MAQPSASRPEAPQVTVAVLSSVHRWNDTRILVRQAASLAAAGYDVVLAAIGDQGQPFAWRGVRVVPFRRRSRLARWKLWGSLARVVFRERARVVHVHDPELIPLALFLKLTGRRVICDVHENVSEQVLNKEWMPRALRRPVSGVLRGLMRGLPSVSDAVILAEDSYFKAVPAAPNVAVIHNFPALPPRTKEDYRTDVLRLIYVGDVRRVRGIDEYVAITDRLVREGVPVELRVIGSFASADEQAATVRTIERLGLTQRIHLLGRQPPEEIPRLLEQGDIGLSLLHPIGNYRESYPTKMFEYMAAGLPVIASRFPLWAAVLDGNTCGRVVDPLNVDEAVKAILEYWRSPVLREEHGRNGRAAVVSRYNWDVETPALLGIYARLVSAS
jgi:glycosyltransferase involved in cell wall biosynthesis